MSTARGENRVGAQRRPATDDAVKSARRKARAADSRRRALLSQDRAVTDGSLALSPVAEPVEVETPKPRRDQTTAPARSARKAPPEPVTTARMPFVLSILGLIAGGIVGLLVLNTAINGNAFELQDLREKQTKLDAKEQRLTDELADVKAPGNLAAAADRLGLVEAEEITYLRLPDGKELKMPTPGGN
ncbi:hypothetical protein [Stackebrandtia nassauensis]|uniref:Septum formation initiator n=1 Tax=Stackebrandtia nassauensis (strain DSM 44728 / CIP 108903 / NRRL B-16338 / NBRC 102104 / LLR-40K-21) TaxID=446470 RepID=D3Q770_STANL|nr:hypothetical protein [Stackebrandtia nassauensis]ADD42341.1 hypothetical protein Snas_2664 [Stackebrandtia nassauensis DSM 44728]